MRFPRILAHAQHLIIDNANQIQHVDVHLLASLARVRSIVSFGSNLLLQPHRSPDQINFPQNNLRSIFSHLRYHAPYKNLDFRRVYQMGRPTSEESTKDPPGSAKLTGNTRKDAQASANLTVACTRTICSSQQNSFISTHHFSFLIYQHLTCIIIPSIISKYKFMHILFKVATVDLMPKNSDEFQTTSKLLCQ